MFPYKELSANLRLDLEEACKAHILDEPSILSDWDSKTCAAWALWRSFYKKLAPNGITSGMIETAQEKFLRLNRSIPDGPFQFNPQNETESLFWDYFKDNVHKTLSESPFDAGFGLAFVSERLATGPGASIKANSESFYTKLFQSRLTATHPQLHALYRAAISGYDSWASAERQRHQEFGEEIVSGNRLFFVPKTTEIARTCCTEPAINMLMQKAIGAYLEERLEVCFGIRLDTQPDLNRALARIGSVDGTFGTIDLQSASDSIRLALCEEVIPNHLLGWLKITRSPETIMPDGSIEKLRMISTMGNGFTFPLQTILFACVVRSVYSLMSISERYNHGVRSYGVFGDDIIVRESAYNFVCAMLQKLGFVVNDTKSFNTGGFRESCGYDYAHGDFIRGVYIDNLETVSKVLSAINRLNRWSSVHSIRLRRTVGLLHSKLSKRIRKMHVPPQEAIDSGVMVPFRMTRPSVDDRYWFRYEKFVAVSRRRALPEDREGSEALRYRSFNPNGAYVTFLGGYARRSFLPITKNEHEGDFMTSLPELPVAWLGLRIQAGEVAKIKRVRSSVPWWDWSGPEEASRAVGDVPFWDGSPYDGNRFFDHASWQEAVEANL